MNLALSCAVSLLLMMAEGRGDNTGPLTVGSPAPPLKLAAFLRGQPVDQISKGSVYVIEFSGTQCAPCIRAMPHLTTLQKKHATVTFISIYCETRENVRDHLAKHDAEIGYRVALDDDLAMSSTWQQASGIQGIPLVFLVAKDGIIAWIGLPDDLDVALANLEAGLIDPRLERTRLVFGQADGRAALERQKLQERSDKAYARLLSLAKERKWAEAIDAAEQAARDFPDDAFAFHSTKVYVLASNPQSAERAVGFAAELSAMMTFSPLGDFGKGQLGTFDAKIAQALLDGGREHDDRILTEAAAILVGRADEGLGFIKDEDERVSRAKYVSQIAASLDIRRKDFKAAADRLHRTLALIRGRTCPETNVDERATWEKIRQEQIKQVEASLRKCAKAEEECRRRP